MNKTKKKKYCVLPKKVSGSFGYIAPPLLKNITGIFIIVGEGKKNGGGRRVIHSAVPKTNLNKRPCRYS